MDKNNLTVEAIVGTVIRALIDKVADKALLTTQNRYPFLKLQHYKIGEQIRLKERVTVLYSETEQVEHIEIQEAYEMYLQSEIILEATKIITKLMEG